VSYAHADALTTSRHEMGYSRSCQPERRKGGSRWGSRSQAPSRAVGKRLPAPLSAHNLTTDQIEGILKRL